MAGPPPSQRAPDTLGDKAARSGRRRPDRPPITLAD